jgi:hypothetical protein
MKHILVATAIVSAMAISTLGSCKKDDSVQIGGPTGPTTIYATADKWEAQGYHIYVDILPNVIPVRNANQSVSVYVVSNGEETQIDHPISFLGGQLWATHTQTDLVIHYQGELPTPPYFNIMAVIK